MEAQKVRISVANLASYLKNKDTGEVVAIGILNNKRFAKGERFLQALGGAATMTTKGRNLMEETYQAEFLGEGGDKDDARFVVPARYAEEILSLFEKRPSLCERSPMREVLHELEQECFGNHTILLPGALTGVYSALTGVFRQASAEGAGTSARAQAQCIPTRRLFFVHTLCVSRMVFENLCRSSYMQTLSTRELNTTQMGRTKGVAYDGTPMADNLCGWIPGYAD